MAKNYLFDIVDEERKKLAQKANIPTALPQTKKNYLFDVVDKEQNKLTPKEAPKINIEPPQVPFGTQPQLTSGTAPSFLQKQEQFFKEQEAQRKTQDKALNKMLLDNCLEEAEGYHSEMMMAGIENCNKRVDAYACGISLGNELDKNLEEAKEECFKRYPQN